MTLTVERLKRVLEYDAAGGGFRWLVSPSSRVKKGDVAGGVKDNGYVQIRIDGRKYYAHRLAWLYAHGRWPDGEIDHLNGARRDNRLCNLRCVDSQVNKQNVRGAKTNSGTGVLGVFRRKTSGNFIAAIGVDGRQVWLGTYPDAESAGSAYLAAKRVLHPGGTI